LSVSHRRFVQRGDLSDRCVFLQLPPLEPQHRRPEDEFWAAFYKDRPRIFGGLLDAVAGRLRELPSVELPELPRMADFAAFAEAIGRGLGWKEGTVFSDYEMNRNDANATQIEDSVLATAMLATVRGPDSVLNWFGTATDLLEEIGKAAGKNVTFSAEWPKSPSRLTNELRRIVIRGDGANRSCGHGI
jgi:hypothetical protein